MAIPAALMVTYSAYYHSNQKTETKGLLAMIGLVQFVWVNEAATGENDRCRLDVA